MEMTALTMEPIIELDAFIVAALAIVATMAIGYLFCAMCFLFYEIFKTWRKN